MKESIPVIVGPTGSGKTLLGLEWAHRAGGEIISADSRQIYRHLTVGTAKPLGRWSPTPRHPEKNVYWVEGVPHHLVDVLEPTEAYNAGLFARQAGEQIASLMAEGQPVALAGGTGLYLRALIDGLAPLPPRDEGIRSELAGRAAREGNQALHAELARLDPEAAQNIPPNNVARVARALEVHRLTGKPLSWWQKEKTKPSALPFRWYGLLWPKDALERLIAERCRKMLQGGMLEETEALLAAGVPPSAPGLQALGYGLAIDFLQGRLPKEELEEKFIRQTRLYTKRQMTWFRANKRIRWLNVESPHDLFRWGRKIR